MREIASNSKLKCTSDALANIYSGSNTLFATLFVILPIWKQYCNRVYIGDSDATSLDSANIFELISVELLAKSSMKPIKASKTEHVPDLRTK